MKKKINLYKKKRIWRTYYPATDNLKLEIKLKKKHTHTIIYISWSKLKIEINRIENSFWNQKIRWFKIRDFFSFFFVLVRTICECARLCLTKKQQQLHIFIHVIYFSFQSKTKPKYIRIVQEIGKQIIMQLILTI